MTVNEQSVTVVMNRSESEFGSDLLSQLAELTVSAYDAEVDKETKRYPGKKGELVTALAIHLAADLIMELLKVAAKRLINHPLYDPLISLNINGRDVKLEDVAKE